MVLLRNLVIGLLLVVFASSAILLVTHEGRMAIKTTLLLMEVLPNAPAQPLSALTEAPLEERVQFPFSGGRGMGTLYRPKDSGEHGAIVLFLGINPDLDDATLHRLSRALAREGVVVLVPEPAQLTQGQISSQEVELLVGAFRSLAEAPFVDPKRIGFSGFCIGSSLALIAAADPRISDKVRFVNFFGGYFSARGLLSAMTTQQLTFDGVSQRWEPNQDAFRWLSKQLISTVPQEEERELLMEAISNRSSFSSEEVASLSPGARAIHAALANQDPLLTDFLYDSLPEGLRARFDRLSPSSSLEWLQTKIFIMQDRNDTYVPFSEGRRLLGALQDYPRKHYTEFELFRHMHPQEGLEGWDFLREVLKLYYHLYLVLLEVA